MDSWLRDLALHTSDYGVATYLAATILAMAYLLGKGHLVLGSTHRPIVKKCDENEQLLAKVNEKLTEQRILNERSAAKIEALQQDIKALDLENARLKGVVGRMESRER